MRFRAEGRQNERFRFRRVLAGSGLPGVEKQLARSGRKLEAGLSMNFTVRLQLLKKPAYGRTTPMEGCHGQHRAKAYRPYSR